jgi:hypothetical protein
MSARNYLITFFTAALLGVSPFARASTVLILLIPDRAVVATDSQVNRIEMDSRRLECKVILVAPHIVFSVVGTGRFQKPDFDPYSLGRAAADAGLSPTKAACYYAAKAIQPLQQIWESSRERYLQFMPRGGPVPTSVGPQTYVFVGIEKPDGIVVAGGDFLEEGAGSTTLRHQAFRYTAKTPADIFFFRSGVTSALPTDQDIATLMTKLGAPATLEHLIAVQAAVTPTFVALPSTVLILKRDGVIE